MNVYAAGDFKSGPEGFTRNDMLKQIGWRVEFVTPVWKSIRPRWK